MGRYIAAIVALILCVVAASVVVATSRSFQACEAKYQPTTTNQGDPYAEQNDSTDFGGVIRRCVGAYVVKNNPGITALSSFLLVFVTVGLIFIGYEQFATTRAQLRAYVHVTLDVGEPLRMLPGEQPTLRFTLENSGETPGIGVYFRANLEIFDATEPDVLPLPPNSEVPGRLMIHPGQKITLSSWRNTKLIQGDIDAVRAGSKRLFFYGEIRYRDVFRRRHITQFRYRSDDGSQRPPGAPADRRGLEVCMRGNKIT